MPKHGFKWRTERLKLISTEALYERFISSAEVHHSAKLARWVYENLANWPESNHIRIAILNTIGFDEAAPWARTFLWGELARQKHNELGDWIVVALARQGESHPEEIERFVALYEDETAHQMTRGSAVFAINNAASSINGKTRPTAEALQLARDTCAKALGDESNPYARAGACWLAQTLGGFDAELGRLKEDRTPIRPGEGLTVADHAIDGVPKRAWTKRAR